MDRRTFAASAAASGALAAALLAAVPGSADAAFTAEEWACSPSNAAPYTATVAVEGVVTARDTTGRAINSFTVLFRAPLGEPGQYAPITGSGHTVSDYLLSDPATDPDAAPASTQPFSGSGNTFSYTGRPVEERPAQVVVAFDPADGSVFCAAIKTVDNGIS